MDALNASGVVLEGGAPVWAAVSAVSA
eukprot:COSAG01_NODE_50419_length_363_cov_1.731061_1_plen_26_part_10